MEVVRCEHRDQPVEFLEPILQRRRGEHDGLGCGAADLGDVCGDFGLPGPVGAQPVGLIADHEIPRADYLRGLRVRELIRADEDLIFRSWLNQLVNVGAVEQACGEGEFFAKFLLPLLAQRRRRNDQNAPVTLCPVLGDDDSSLDRFTEPDLVGKDHSVQEWSLQGKQRRIDLMRFGFNLCVEQEAGKLADMVGRIGTVELMSVELGLIVT